ANKWRFDRARLQIVDAGERPSAESLTEQAFLRAGQIPYERPDDAMWRVEGRHAPIRAQIERVGGEAAAAGGRKHFANVVYALRVSVGETEEQSLAQTALDARLQRMIVGIAGVVADPNAAV